MCFFFIIWYLIFFLLFHRSLVCGKGFSGFVRAVFESFVIYLPNGACGCCFFMERVLLLCATGAFVTWTCSEVLGSPPALRLATAPQSSGLPSTSTLSCPFSWGKTSLNLNLKRFDRERWRGGAAGEKEKVTKTEWDEREGERAI